MRCGSCGFENPEGLRFCGNCGTALVPGQTAKPAEERRLVTVLFADVAGSTALGEELDPEEFRAYLARYYGIAREVVLAHGGTVAKFIGDAVMAVFGLPQAHGDDAARALSAALELRDRVRSDPRLGERLPIRLGVNTGEVVTTREDPAGDFLIAGDAVNVAARLEQAAESWAVLCSERTARAAGDVFLLGPLIEVEAKGKTLPVRAFEVRGRAGGATARRVPLIGRDADLAQLDLVARRAFGERRPFLVSVIAPAGTGKSRLLEEFLDRLPGLASGATVTIAQCLPYGQRLTYWPLRAVLFRFLGVGEEEPADRVRESARAWLGEAGVEGADRLGELLAATVGLGDGEVSDRGELFTAWRTAIEVASRRAPLVLAFEDLHWSSESLLDLVEFVMQPRGDAPVLVFALARPELLDRRPAWGGGRRNYMSLALEPLNDGAVAELVHHLLGMLSPQAIELVVARAEGNPFYAGEIVRSVLERVPSLDDRAAVERALATLPDTVQATVLARLDLLEPDLRRVLQLGAVYGREFRPAGIAALAPALAESAGPAAERLVEKDLVRPAGHDGFAFRHILIREVAYQTLTRAERSRLHAAAADWLEAGGAGSEDALAELIAYHYREAAGLAGAFEEDGRAGEVRRRAVVWLRRAAEVAAAGAALGEAARHLRAAIELAGPGELPELYERLGTVTGGNASVEAYRTALRLLREQGCGVDQELRVLARLLGLYTRWVGSISARPSAEEIARLRHEGHELARRANDGRALAIFFIADGFLPFWRGASSEASTPEELAEAKASARRGLEIAERLDDAGLQSAALDALGSVAQARGSWREARETARQRLAFQDRLELVERLDAYSMVAWGSALLGDLAEAERVSAIGLTHRLPGQASSWTLHLMAWRIYTLTLQGRWDEVPAAGESACQLWLEAGIPSAGFAIRGFLAALDVARGRQDPRLVERIREVLDEILGTYGPESEHGQLRPYLTSGLEELQKLVLSHVGLGAHVETTERILSLCSDRNRPLPAEALRTIADLAAANSYAIVEAQARRGLGLALGDPGELGRALALFDAAGAIPYAARARCELALLSGETAPFQEGILALGKVGDLEQLDRLEKRVVGGGP